MQTWSRVRIYEKCEYVFMCFPAASSPPFSSGQTEDIRQSVQGHDRSFLLLFESLSNLHHFSPNEFFHPPVLARPGAFPLYILVYVLARAVYPGACCVKGTFANILCQALDFGLVLHESFLEERVLVDKEAVLRRCGIR